MLRKIASILSALVLVSVWSQAAFAAPPTRFTPGASGIGDPYYPLDGNGGYDVIHYDLALGYDPATDRLSGIATMTARATQNLSAFNLDFVGLRLRSSVVNGAQAAANRKGQELTLKPKDGIVQGSVFTVVTTYDGVPEMLDEFGGSGFLHTDDGAIEMGQPHGASSWFPANDHPRDKATFTFHITAPVGLEAIANGNLLGSSTANGKTTWNWDAPEPMATYLAMMAVGHFDVDAYSAGGVSYYDAIDPSLLEPLSPAVSPESGSQFLYSQVADTTYKRLTRTIAVPAGGATLAFDVHRDTEPGWDFLFVEARTAGGDDWTTLPDANGHTSQDVGNCPYNYWGFQTQYEHYLTPFVADEGDPSTPDDDNYSCTATGTTGEWNAVSGASDGWEHWSVGLPDAGGAPRQVEVSISYASDGVVQGQGVEIDDVTVSTGPGSTGFENDGNVLDGWVVAPAPAGSEPNANSWTVATTAPAVPGIGSGAKQSLARESEIIDWESDVFGPYPFSSSGGVVDNVEVFFALENQTRVTYSPFFFGPDQPDYGVVVHELAHQWFGDNLAVDTWQHIWLNEGFASYAEWMWSEHEGDATADQIFSDFAGIPADDPFWEMAIGDPGTEQLFDFPVYARGAMTLHALRTKVGDQKFFRILQTWAAEQAGGTVTTREFIDLAERIAKKDLDPLFAMWLGPGKPDIASGPGNGHGHGPLSVNRLSAGARTFVEAHADRPGQPFRDAKGLAPRR
ncbi:MAG TPA: M1 family metallopeptidase [Candidatus Limnocylindrales bacterium]|nr:M1 family metallopeptidase [Candidatus Limnocylindrales bacterium]